MKKKKYRVQNLGNPEKKLYRFLQEKGNNKVVIAQN